MNESVEIETFPNTMDADIAKNLLEANGIRATVMADDAGGMLPPMTNQVRLMVMEEDAEVARDILHTSSKEGRKSRPSNS